MAKLLIVDDETDVREFVANFFRKRKLEVITAKNGQEAVDLFNRYIPDLTLLDIKMEGIDGIETLRQIRETDNNAKVIMLTGQRPEELEAFNRCRELGALYYIHKPVELDDLEQMVMKTFKILI